MASGVDIPKDLSNPDNVESDEAREQRKTTIRALFETGTLFYTKQGIRDIQKQLDATAGPDYKIFVKGINGRSVCLETNPPDPWRPRSGRPPEVYFEDVQSMLRRPKYPGPYCSMRFAFTSQSLAPRESQVIQKWFQQHRAEWEKSNVCHELRAKLRSCKLSTDIRKIIGISLGTMGEGEEECAQRCYQHAMLLTLRDTLHAVQPDKPEPQCFVQDPAYSDGDTKAMEGIGISILEHPNAFLEVDDSTVVVSFSSNVPVKQVVLDLARPAIIIWNEGSHAALESSERFLTTDPDSPRTQHVYERFYESTKLDAGEMLLTPVLRVRRLEFGEIAGVDEVVGEIHS